MTRVCACACACAVCVRAYACVYTCVSVRVHVCVRALSSPETSPRSHVIRELTLPACPGPALVGGSAHRLPQPLRRPRMRLTSRPPRHSWRAMRPHLNQAPRSRAALCRRPGSRGKPTRTLGLHASSVAQKEGASARCKPHLLPTSHRET